MQDSFHYEGKKKEIDAMLGSIRLQHIMDLVNILEYVSWGLFLKKWNNEMITKILCAWIMETWNKVNKTLTYALKGGAYFIKSSCKWMHVVPSP